MNTKLTLKIDKGIIERAKEYAFARNQSLSQLVEDYFRKLIESNDFKESLPPKVRKLSGILKSKDIDYKIVLEKQLRKNTLN